MNNATVLNTDFLYLGETTFPRALSLVRRGRAEIVRHRGEVRTVSLTCRIPEIIRMLAMVDFRRRKVPLTKRNILESDDYTCQYCSETHGRMTVDHVRPRSKGEIRGETSFALAHRATAASGITTCETSG